MPKPLFNRKVLIYRMALYVRIRRTSWTLLYWNPTNTRHEISFKKDTMDEFTIVVRMCISILFKHCLSSTTDIWSFQTS